MSNNMSEEQQAQQAGVALAMATTELEYRVELLNRYVKMVLRAQYAEALTWAPPTCPPHSQDGVCLLRSVCCTTVSASCSASRLCSLLSCMPECVLPPGAAL